MAQIALPRHQATQSQSAGIGSPLYQRRQHSNAGPIELIPNPEFSFPMRGPDVTASEPVPITSRPMSLQAYPAGRRGSMPHQRQKSVNALPEFSFNPAGAAKPSTGTSPPHSPSTLPATPSKPIHGHRRGGSEFIGGAGTALMSSSPTKGDGVLPPPSTTLRPGPPAGRRGHAHRRSGAISSHDLTSIMNPPAPTRSGSAPATPSEGNEFHFGHSFNRSISQPSLRDTSADDESAARPPSRARVGFSDRVEYIRPLSTISSETETSMSTIRGHSATNSLSSIVGGSSPQSARAGRPSLSTVEDEGRPSTAGAVLDKFMSSSLNVESSDRKRPMSAISPISPTAPNARVPAKRRGFFRLESRRSDNSVHTLSSSVSDPALSQSLDTPLVSPLVDEDESAEDVEKSKSVSRKTNRKPRKVKSWANSILPRKVKHSKKSQPRSATPPPDSLPDAEDTDASEDLDWEPNFDEDTTVTIVSPTESSAPEPKLDTNFASWQPRQLKRVDSDIMSPIIDLDAALGPFNTPNSSSPRNQQRGFSAHRRAMHSANGLAPNHRRTESAPELVPFDLRSSSVTTASPMADVFEEEEPEEEESTLPKRDSKPSSVTEEAEEPKISVVEADGKQEGAAINWNFNDGLGIRRTERGLEVNSLEPLSPRAVPQNVSSEHIHEQSQDASPVEVVEDYEEPRTSSLTHSSDSTVTPQPPADELKEQQPVMNLSLPLPQQSLMTPDTVTSSFSSPDYRSSQISFDTPRVGTAASSMSDYAVMPSPRFGEPGPELRVSVDDVPSLTSSRSTMTSAMQNAFPLPSPRRPGDRTASLSSDPSEVEFRRRKRSSIASLSRLINSSSYGERSKLSIEQRPQSEYLEPAKEKKKNNRLSKLKFWKSTKDLSSSRT
ncbi:Nn.00g001270.m01.CDS01 [Neocucurbitaria sp. VM-36]